MEIWAPACGSTFTLLSKEGTSKNYILKLSFVLRHRLMMSFPFKMQRLCDCLKFHLLVIPIDLYIQRLVFPTFFKLICYKYDQSGIRVRAFLVFVLITVIEMTYIEVYLVRLCRNVHEEVFGVYCIACLLSSMLENQNVEHYAIPFRRK